MEKKEKCVGNDLLVEKREKLCSVNERTTKKRHFYYLNEDLQRRKLASKMCVCVSLFFW